MKIQDAILYGSKRGSGSGPTPSGSIEISENGTYDVTDKAEAVVNVQPNLTTKQITQNGTYSASSDNKDGYSSVTVAVPSADLITKNITQNGTYQASSDNADGYSAVTVAVPQPSGKITIQQNGTDIDVSSYALADVNVSGGASNEDAIIERSISGEYTNNNVSKIRSYVFYACKQLTSVSSSSATEIGESAFYYCDKITSASFPSVTRIYKKAFGNATELANIYFPALKTVDGDSFFNCTSLTDVYFPSATSVAGGAFSGCSNLLSITLPSVISIYGFQNLQKLERFDFTALRSISDYSLFNLSMLSALIMRGNVNVSLEGTNALINTPIASGTGYIYVPAALVDLYKAATNWSTYATQFRALEDYTVDGTTTGALDPSKI